MGKKWLVVAAAVLVAVVAGIGAGYLVWNRPAASLAQSSVLSCTDKQVAGMVGQAFDQSDIAHFENVKAISIAGVTETGFKTAEQARHCAATVIASDRSQHPVAYWVENAADQQFRVRLTILKLGDDTPAPAKPN